MANQIITSNNSTQEEFKNRIIMYLQCVNKSGNTFIIEHNFKLSLDILIQTGNSKQIRKQMKILRTQLLNSPNKNNDQINQYNDLCRETENLICNLIHNNYPNKIIIGI